ncbi:hypothetical protein Peur_073013 [Populus x canadensis]
MHADDKCTVLVVTGAGTPGTTALLLHSRGARKLARTPHVNQKKKKNYTFMHPAYFLLIMSSMTACPSSSAHQHSFTANWDSRDLDSDTLTEDYYYSWQS